MSILQTAQTWLRFHRQTNPKAHRAEEGAARRPPCIRLPTTSGSIRTRGTAFFLLLIPTLAFAHKMGTAHFEPPQAGPKGEAPGTARVALTLSGSVSHWLSLKSNLGYVLLGLLLPGLVLAQSSPFQTGATALQSNLLTLLTPVAIILVIGLGVMAMANRIAWGWCIGAISGIAVAFGAPQIVGWIRGMFGV